MEIVYSFSSIGSNFFNLQRGGIDHGNSIQHSNGSSSNLNRTGVNIMSNMQQHVEDGDFEAMPHFHTEEALEETALEETVFNLWETGMSWDDIADSVFIPVWELIERPAIADLYNK